MTDLLSIYKEHNIGWALWNLDGSFGILDSDRADVTYENFTLGSGEGAQLDRQMLDVLVAAVP